MKKTIIGLILAFSAPLYAETWKNAPIVDTACYSKVKNDPDKHETKCMIACARSGFGIITADGAFLKFDDAGNAKTSALLKETTMKDHLRVTVSGERMGDSIRVTSVSLK